MDALSLNYLLSKFVMEVAKKTGERYPAKTIYGIVCGIRRHLEEKNGAEALILLITAIEGELNSYYLCG